MPIPCPLCQHPFPPGATSCPGCGASLLLEAVPGSTHPVCAAHPTLRSLATCERCGAFACARCLRPGPQGETLCARCQQLEPDVPVPWDLRGELGTLRAFWKTLVQVLIQPNSFAQARAEGRARDSLLFVLLCSLPACFMMGLIYLVIFGAMPSLAMAFAPPDQPPKDTSGLGMMPWLGAGLFVAFTFLGPLVSVAMTVVGAGLDHLVLRASGATRSFQVTLRAHSLSQAPWALGVVPFLGTQIAPFWALVARVFAYRGLHRTTWGPAIAGALLVPLTTCCMCGGGYLALILFAFRHGS
jgi:hypothetical protein